jgi:hypothetical protein
MFNLILMDDVVDGPGCPPGGGKDGVRNRWSSGYIVIEMVHIIAAMNAIDIINTYNVIVVYIPYIFFQDIDIDGTQSR